MQTTLRKSSKTKENTTIEEQAQSTRRDENLKKSNLLSTPRNFAQKTAASATDIYTQKKSTPQSTRAPKKVGTTSTNKASPMKDLLKSSPSSVSHLSSKSLLENKKPKTSSTPRTKKVDDAKVKVDSARSTITNRNKLPFTNVTVNSPPARRKLELDNQETGRSRERNTNTTPSSVRKKSGLAPKASETKSSEVRQRQKTRTLNEDEVKVLTPASVDNNAEMLNLAKKLKAKPKAFFVDLEANKSWQIVPSTSKADETNSNEDYSYEDDFESYESDFESYHSESRSDHSASEMEQSDDTSKRDSKDEERMLDSGSFELYGAKKSANKTKPTIMDFIVEDSEAADDKKSSLTDEGFQDMSSSMTTVSHTDVLDRPLYLHFETSKAQRKRRQINERLKQRAKDILSMINLHEMSYSLFEMQPIPYDLYMATFGRNNYTQCAVQTFDDGNTEETQTENIYTSNKWTQHPVEFSKSEVYLNSVKSVKAENDVDFLAKFTFLFQKPLKEEKSQKNSDNEYKANPLRIYFEQRNGAGCDQMLPKEKYEEIIKNTEYNTDRLKKFLKKTEGRISNILTFNAGNTEPISLIKSSKIPFSKGYTKLFDKNQVEDKNIKLNKVTGLIFSKSKANLIVTIHNNAVQTCVAGKSLVCVWDISIVNQRPIKVLTVIDNIILGLFNGNTDGIFVASLQDGSIHLWDLSEKTTICDSIASMENKNETIETQTKNMTQIKKDREWNRQIANFGSNEEDNQYYFQASAYTNSSMNIQNQDITDNTVGLQFVDLQTDFIHDDGRKIIGQICSLQRNGVLTTWLIVQEKSKKIHHDGDSGKAYWSKMKLEKNFSINLAQNIENTHVVQQDFNLAAAKKRLFERRQNRNDFLRPMSAVKTDRPASVARKKFSPHLWENGIICTDLKVMKVDGADNYLVSKNCGEVLCCKRMGGNVKIHRFSVVCDNSTMIHINTCIGTDDLPFFLTTSDSDTLHLCSLQEYRVLLTLDCRNAPIPNPMERCHGDRKGRYLGTIPVKPVTFDSSHSSDPPKIATVLWSSTNPCHIFTLSEEGAISAWDLTHSDIKARHHVEDAGNAIDVASGCMALLTNDGEVHLHKLVDQEKTGSTDLFKKYVALL